MSELLITKKGLESFENQISKLTKERDELEVKLVDAIACQHTAERENAELRATVEKCLKDIGVTSKEKCKVMDENYELRAKLDRLESGMSRLTTDYNNVSETYRIESEKVKVLRDYASHKADCRAYISGDMEICNCGLKQIIAATATEEGK